MKATTGKRIMAATLILTSVRVWAGPYEIVDTEDTLSLLRDGQVLWTFNHRVEEGKPYVHPLTTTRGQNYTDLRPEDHPWHRALWFSWKFIN